MLSFDINNKRQLHFVQDEHDKAVLFQTIDSKGNTEKQLLIPAKNMVMLYNLYVYIIENDIKNGFVNPYGENKYTEL